MDLLTEVIKDAVWPEGINLAIYKDEVMHKNEKLVKCENEGGILTATIINPKDIKKVVRDQGIITRISLKRKYGKFDRKVITIDLGEGTQESDILK